MYLMSVISVLLMIISMILYRIFRYSFSLSCAITFGTVSYHFLMRLSVGLIIDSSMNNKADYSKKWYRSSLWEKRLYKLIKVKKWKSRVPTFEPDYFEHQNHDWREIAQAMCQAEIVHEVIFVLSFIPIAFSHWFGALPIFIITSILAAVTDLVFVIIQRYNRPRVIKLIEKNDMHKYQ